MKLFANKVVVITGGGSGIGKACAEKFNQAGAKVVIFGRDKIKLEQTKQHLANAITVQGDVSKISDLDNLYQTTFEHFGNLDVLIVNAGITNRRKIEEVDEKFFDEIVNINFKGAYFTVQRAVPYFNKNAAVVLLSSIASHFARPGHSVYAAAKAAVSALARNFSADLMDRGIRVNAVSPGYTLTPIHEKRAAVQAGYLEGISKQIPLRRFATAADIANAIYFLASPQAAYIAGIDLLVDGGKINFTTIK